MKKFLIVAAFLASPAALAQDTTGTMTITHVYPLVAVSKNGTTIFRMEDGSCLRGPLMIAQEDGKEVFRLEAGKEYPTGCSAH